MLLRNFALILFAFALAACSSSVHRDAQFGLTEEYAANRANRVKNVSYALNIQLDEKSTSFQGSVGIRFEQSQNESPLTVDFIGGEIKKVTVNGKSLSSIVYNKKFLTLPDSALMIGENTVEIEFEHPYSTTGAGLYRFVDREDGSVYLYTDFEPYDANQLFPCFDQPDLKAEYQLTVDAPKSWVVVSSKLESGVEDLSGDKKRWNFPASHRFSTYIFSLHAGPYRVWKAKAGKIPMRLMARKSFAKYMDPNDWFKISRQGFRFYEQYFDYPYPFEKYDQLIVPDFNSGAMENTAAVTFREGYMPAGKPTRAQRERRANVILHEMAHMWFGNLVTMKWWDDLWLNESFATYMASVALAEATEFKDAWQTFFDKTKTWAYWEDDLVTTHPIVAKVPNTDQAFVNFDGITYGKGASALKQLAFLLGEKNFKNGVQQYFKKYAWTNTRMKDFIGSLGEASDADLTLWTDQWLRTANHNRVQANFHCQEGRVTSFGLVQTSPESHPELRTHRTVVGLYGLRQGKLQQYKEIPITYAGKHTLVAEAIGEDCPLLVYPNVDDYDFAMVKLDKKSLDTLKDNLSLVRNDLSRMMLWQSLWDMVRVTEISAWEYAELVFRNLPKEKNFRIAARAAGRIVALKKYLPRDTDEQKQRLDKYTVRAENFLWARLESARPRSDLQKLWLDTFVDMAHTPASQEKLAKLITGEIRFRGLVVDQDRRWDIIRTLHRENWPEASALREAELAKDDSEKGQKAALAAIVSQPQLTVKQEWFTKVTAKNSDLPLARLKVAMANIFPSDQEELTATFLDDYFVRLRDFAGYKEDVFLSYFTEYMNPAICSTQSVSELAKFIDSNGDLTPVVTKQLKINHQEDGRCVRIRKRASSTQLTEDNLETSSPSE